MKKVFSVFFAATLLLVTASCGDRLLKGEGKKSVDVRQLPAFDALDISISSDVVINVNEGVAQKVELSGYENVMKHVKTEVKGGVLHVEFDLDDTWTVDGDDIKVTITVPSLRLLSMSGAHEAELHGDIRGAEFQLDLSGATGVTIDNINVDKFEADLSGVAGLEVKGGSVKHASYDISGGGKIEAYPLQTEETELSFSGGADGEVSASKKLDVSISGAGSVKYKGDPVIEKHISGVGSVSKAE